MNILFTCAGRRTYLLKYFKENMQDGDKIVATDMQMSAPALSAADVAITVPGVYEKNYVDKILEVCKNYNINMLISLNDLELPILATHKKKFEELGVKVIVSSEEVVNICFDKMETIRFVETIGLKCPKTFVNIDRAIEALENGQLFFPLILKPRWGSGSIGIEEAHDMNDLTLIYTLLKRKIKKTILSNASTGEDYIMIQQMILGKEYGLDIMNDFDGNNISVSVKQKLAMRAGETDKAVTIDNIEIKEIGAKIGRSLKHIGNLDCDVLEENGNYYVLEMNPRFGGGFPFSYEAGVNLPKAYIEWAKGNEVDPRILQPKIGEIFAKCDYLVKR